MTNKYIVTYEEIEEAVRIMVPQIKAAYQTKNKTPQEMVTISRGGLFFGGLFSYALNIRHVDVLCLESYTKDNKQGQIHQIRPFGNYTRPHALIVDDLVDSGKTIDYVRGITYKTKYESFDIYPGEQVGVLKLDREQERVFNTFYEPVIATMFWKGLGSKPDAYYKQLPAETWVQFPWDKLEE